MIKLQRVWLNPLTIILFVCAYFFDYAAQLSIAYAIILAHELAHIAAAGAFDIAFTHIEIHPFGVSAKLVKNIENPMHDVFISLAGPASNLILAALCSNQFWVQTNLSLAIFNLIPIIPLDGARAFRAFLTEKWGMVKAFNFTRKFSRWAAGAFLVFIAISAFFFKINFSILIIIAFLIANISCEVKAQKLVQMRNLIYSREKLEAPRKTIHIAAKPETVARLTLKEFGYNAYYLIDVIDGAKFVKTLTETEIIDNIKAKGSRVIISEI